MGGKNRAWKKNPWHVSTGIFFILSQGAADKEKKGEGRDTPTSTNVLRGGR